MTITHPRLGYNVQIDDKLNPKQAADWIANSAKRKTGRPR